MNLFVKWKASDSKSTGHSLNFTFISRKPRIVYSINVISVSIEETTPLPFPRTLGMGMVISSEALD